MSNCPEGLSSLQILVMDCVLLFPSSSSSLLISPRPQSKQFEFQIKKKLKTFICKRFQSIDHLFSIRFFSSPLVSCIDFALPHRGLTADSFRFCFCSLDDDGRQLCSHLIGGENVCSWATMSIVLIWRFVRARARARLCVLFSVLFCRNHFIANFLIYWFQGCTRFRSISAERTEWMATTIWDSHSTRRIIRHSPGHKWSNSNWFAIERSRFGWKTNWRGQTAEIQFSSLLLLFFC